MMGLLHGLGRLGEESAVEINIRGRRNDECFETAFYAIFFSGKFSRKLISRLQSGF